MGELQTRSYEAKDGSKRNVTEIVADDVEFLAKPNGAQGASAPAAKPAAKNDAFADEMGSMGDVLMEDEDLPF